MRTRAVALLEILTYGAIVSHPDNLAKITNEIEKRWHLRLCEGIHHIILAPQEYWDRWRNEKRRIKRWEQFRELCKALRDGPCAIQCFALDQDLGSNRLLDRSPSGRLTRLIRAFTEFSPLFHSVPWIVTALKPLLHCGEDLSSKFRMDV